MSFLNFFKKTPKGPRINVRVWINQAAKELACTKMAKKDKTLIFIAWSKVTYDHFKKIFLDQGIPNEIMMASKILPSRMTQKNFVFLERHFDHEKEIKFLQSLKVNSALAHVSLLDPLLLLFNSDRIKKMLENMGHKEEEFIEHKMIDKSIEKAMEKIKNGDRKEFTSESLKEWIEGIV